MRRLFLIPFVCALLLAGCGGERKDLQTGDPSTGQPAVSSPEQGASPSVAPSPSPVPSSESAAPQPVGIVPAEIDIPDIGVEAKVVALGLTKEGAMDVPKNDEDVGWFEPGYRPGVAGSSVVAGHVDSKTGPAVFYNLKKLKKGSKIIVRSKDGEERIFRVVGQEAYSKDEAPLKEIFGPSDKPILNLITCTGLYSRSQGTHQERLVVTAVLEQNAA